MLKPLGFSVERPVFSEGGTPDIENLYARRSGNGPHLMFAGHTDVVPAGDETAWTHPPFSAAISRGEMYGRGAVDMKGGIACFHRGSGAPYRKARRRQGLDLVADHRRRGRAGDQRHRQAARLGGVKGRSLGRGDRRRADQSRSARRHDQDRPARLAVGRHHRQRPPGAFGLSASRRQSGARADATRRRAAQAGLRHRHERFPADQSRNHVDRYRQSGGQRDPGKGNPRLQHPLQRQLDGRNAAERNPQPARPCGRKKTYRRAARSRSTTISPGATGRATSS